MKTSCRFLTLLCLLCVSLRAERESAVSWIENLHLSASGTASWVNNHSRTSHVSTRKDAATYELSLSGGNPRQLAPNWLLLVNGEVSALSVRKYDLADNLQFGGQISLQRKFGLGPMVPMLQINAGTSYKAARLNDDQGWTTEGGIRLSQRVFSNLRLAANARWVEHNAQSAVFDINQRSLSVEANWDINEHWSLNGNVTRLEGDIVANAAWAVWVRAINGGFGPTVFNYYTSRPWSETNIYGPRWVSYNVEADVDLWSLALTYSWSDHTSLEFRRSGAYVVNRIGITYPTDSWSLSLAHRF